MTEYDCKMTLQFIDESIRVLKSLREIVAPGDDNIVMAHGIEYKTTMAKLNANLQDIGDFYKDVEAEHIK